MTVNLISFLKYLYLFVSLNTKKLCESNQQKPCSKVLNMPHHKVIFKLRDHKNTRITLTDTYRGIYFLPSSNNTPSSSPYIFGSKIKAAPKEKYN